MKPHKPNRPLDRISIQRAASYSGRGKAATWTSQEIKERMQKLSKKNLPDKTTTPEKDNQQTLKATIKRMVDECREELDDCTKGFNDLISRITEQPIIEVVPINIEGENNNVEETNKQNT